MNKKMQLDIEKLIEVQKEFLLGQDLSLGETLNQIFQENDVVQNYILENCIPQSEVDLQVLRVLQYELSSFLMTKRTEEIFHALLKNNKNTKKVLESFLVLLK